MTNRFASKPAALGPSSGGPASSNPAFPQLYPAEIRPAHIGTYALPGCARRTAHIAGYALPVSFNSFRQSASTRPASSSAPEARGGISTNVEYATLDGSTSGTTAEASNHRQNPTHPTKGAPRQPPGSTELTAIGPDGAEQVGHGLSAPTGQHLQQPQHRLSGLAFRRTLDPQPRSTVPQHC